MKAEQGEITKMLELEIRLMQPRANECRQPPDSGQGKNISSLKLLEGASIALLTALFQSNEANFRLLSFRTVKEQMCAVEATKFLVIYYNSHKNYYDYSSVSKGKHTRFQEPMWEVGVAHSVSLQ